MRALNIIFNILKNKYFIALAMFAVFMLYYDKNDVFVQLEKEKELKDLRQSQAFYEKEVGKLRTQLTELEENPEKLQTYARENLFMKKSDEDIFIVEPAVDYTKQKK